MAQKILVIGDSGSGKSRSMKNLNPKTTYIINCIGKNLPFKSWKTNYTEGKGGNIFKSTNSDEICQIMHAISEKRPEIKTIVIDDAQYIMSYEYMNRALEKGFQKFSEMAKNMFEVLITPERLRSDLTVVYLAHSEDVSANGFTKTRMKTVGKMLDSAITLEGLFTIVLLAGSYKAEDGMHYVFLTQSDGTTIAKSPEGLFETLSIENDLQYVLDKIQKYEE